eukprot:TRINITY_DN25402_c0_g1_i1.p1 TRINITY_DN25402_c0_g1~~TRINITY_DN25402_c0_g1_i1.p1  ORF type:complete len:338 (-),score=62.77 TRINITY_DN25402_c0_g1_i1:108-1121(-)
MCPPAAGKVAAEQMSDPGAATKKLSLRRRSARRNNSVGIAARTASQAAAVLAPPISASLYAAAPLLLSAGQSTDLSIYHQELPGPAVRSLQALVVPFVPPRLPLSDHRLDLKTTVALLSSAQSREKCLKIVQYIARLLAYVLASFASIGDNAMRWSAQAAGLAKSTSQARRFFKFFRWVKHFEDVAPARSESSFAVACLMVLSIVWNLVADLSEDICSLERLGFLTKGTLPVWAELNANRCQLVLALVEIALSFVRFRHFSRAAAAALAVEDADAAFLRCAWRRRCMAALELSKFCADLGKAFWDCEMSFASELLFILCGLWASLVSTHKFALRAIK